MTNGTRNHATIAVIILNWKRPENIGRIVRTASEALPAASIFVIDQGEGPYRLADRHDVPFDRCWMRTQANAGPGVRFRLAADWPYDHYLCIDDDMFLTVGQIRRLMAKLREDPEAAHGVIGQQLIRYGPGHRHLHVRVMEDAQVSMLNCVYAFTRARARKTVSLAASVGYERWEDVMRTEDILLSATGPARVHGFGPLEQCGTSSAEDIAVSQQSGFKEERRLLLVRLMRSGHIYVPAGEIDASTKINWLRPQPT